MYMTPQELMTTYKPGNFWEHNGTWIGELREQLLCSPEDRDGDTPFFELLNDIKLNGIKESVVLSGEQGMVFDGNTRVCIAWLLELPSIPVRFH